MQSTCHPQYDLLIVEALDVFADRVYGTNAVRAARARRLACNIAAEHGLDVGDALFQIDAGVEGNRYATDHGRCPQTSDLTSE